MSRRDSHPGDPPPPLLQTEREYLAQEAGYQVQRLGDLPHTPTVAKAKAMLTGWGVFDNRELRRRVLLAAKVRE